MATHDPPTAPGIASPQPGTPTHHPDGHAFIGGKAKEMGARLQKAYGGDAKIADTGVKKKDSSKGEKRDEKCSACGETVEEDQFFCGMCGVELGRKDIAKTLGIKLTDEDVSEYFFKGYLVKELEIAHGKKGVFKTLLPKEMDELESKMMERFKDKDVSQAQWSNISAITGLSYGWVKFDGVSFGETASDRFDYLMEKMGPHVIDIASKKWTILNRSVQAMLEDPDVIKN